MGTVRALSGNGSLARVPVCVRTAWVGSHFGSSMHSTQVASQPQPFRRAHSEHTSTLVGMSQHSMRAHTGSTLISILLACGTSVEHVCLFTLTGLSSSGRNLLVFFCFFRVGGILLTEQILHGSVHILVSPPRPRTLILTCICL